MTEQRKLRMGLAGGGPGAFIGPVHRIAAELDGRIEMVAGAFSSSPEKSRAAGESFRIDLARAYASFDEMLRAEKQRDDGIDFVVIATPNSLHLPMAKAALEAGIPVVSDKPATATYEEVLELEKAVTKAGIPYALTHTYAGYALLRLNNGAAGVLMCSQIATGEGNGLRIRIYGETASLQWAQEDPNRLHLRHGDGREEIRHAAGPYLTAEARAVTRLPGGHPEG